MSDFAALMGRLSDKYMAIRNEEDDLWAAKKGALAARMAYRAAGFLDAFSILREWEAGSCRPPPPVPGRTLAGNSDAVSEYHKNQPLDKPGG